MFLKLLKSLPLVWVLMLMAACNGQVQTLKTTAGNDSAKVNDFAPASWKIATSCTNNILFKSDDNGKTWKNVSAGLPENASIGDIFLKEKEVFLGTQSGFFQQTKDAEIWQPAPADIKEKNPYEHTPLIISDGAMLVGSRKGVRKSNDKGKTWRVVNGGGWAGEIVESEGVLLCTNEQGILRSTDGGETWESVISEGGVGIDLEVIKGGFAAITFNTKSETRRVRISKDGGKNWEAIDAGLPPQLSISGIKEMGNSFFCGHPDGVYRSEDQGKTWKLMLPSVGKKVFNLFVLGNVIYAVPRNGGC
jgi:photosystem II stability/assembly factor-like uncharacterized protein